MILVALMPCLLRTASTMSVSEGKLQKTMVDGRPSSSIMSHNAFGLDKSSPESW